MLEARFPRIPGDMGNAGSWPFPVLYRVVRGATPERVVREQARGLLPDFLVAAKELVELGADGITTKLRVPVALPARPRGACRRPRGDLEPDAGAGGAGAAAAGEARRHPDGEARARSRPSISKPRASIPKRP